MASRYPKGAASERGRAFATRLNAAHSLCYFGAKLHSLRPEDWFCLMGTAPRRLIVGMTGASGAIYGVRLLHLLRGSPIETHLVMSRSAKITLTQEMDMGVAEVSALASAVHQVDNVG